MIVPERIACIYHHILTNQPTNYPLSKESIKSEDETMPSAVKILIVIVAYCCTSLPLTSGFLTNHNHQTTNSFTTTTSSPTSTCSSSSSSSSSSSNRSSS